MTDKIVIDGEITDDGKLIFYLPPELKHKAVKVTIEPKEAPPYEYDEELEKLLDNKSLEGLGLTMGEIALSEEIGVFEDDDSIPDGKTYVDQIRKKRRYSW